MPDHEAIPAEAQGDLPLYGQRDKPDPRDNGKYLSKAHDIEIYREAGGTYAKPRPQLFKIPDENWPATANSGDNRYFARLQFTDSLGDNWLVTHAGNKIEAVKFTSNATVTRLTIVSDFASDYGSLASDERPTFVYKDGVILYFNSQANLLIYHHVDASSPTFQAMEMTIPLPEDSAKNAPFTVTDGSAPSGGNAHLVGRHRFKIVLAVWDTVNERYLLQSTPSDFVELDVGDTASVAELDVSSLANTHEMFDGGGSHADLEARILFFCTMRTDLTAAQKTTAENEAQNLQDGSEFVFDANYYYLQHSMLYSDKADTVRINRDDEYTRDADGNNVFSSTVDTSGTTVTRTAGDYFDYFSKGDKITINSVDYKIASITDLDTLILESSAGSQTGQTATILVSRGIQDVKEQLRTEGIRRDLLEGELISRESFIFSPLPEGSRAGFNKGQFHVAVSGKVYHGRPRSNLYLALMCDLNSDFTTIGTGSEEITEIKAPLADTYYSTKRTIFANYLSDPTQDEQSISNQEGLIPDTMQSQRNQIVGLTSKGKLRYFSPTGIGRFDLIDGLSFDRTSIDFSFTHWAGDKLYLAIKSAIGTLVKFYVLKWYGLEPKNSPPGIFQWNFKSGVVPLDVFDVNGEVYVFYHSGDDTQFYLGKLRETTNTDGSTFEDFIPVIKYHPKRANRIRDQLEQRHQWVYVEHNKDVTAKLYMDVDRDDASARLVPSQSNDTGIEYKRARYGETRVNGHRVLLGHFLEHEYSFVIEEEGDDFTFRGHDLDIEVAEREQQGDDFLPDYWDTEMAGYINDVTSLSSIYSNSFVAGSAYGPAYECLHWSRDIFPNIIYSMEEGTNPPVLKKNVISSNGSVVTTTSTNLTLDVTPAYSANASYEIFINKQKTYMVTLSNGQGFFHAKFKVISLDADANPNERKTGIDIKTKCEDAGITFADADPFCDQLDALFLGWIDETHFLAFVGGEATEFFYIVCEIGSDFDLTVVKYLQLDTDDNFWSFWGVGSGYKNTAQQAIGRMNPEGTLCYFPHDDGTYFPSYRWISIASDYTLTRSTTHPSGITDGIKYGDFIWSPDGVYLYGLKISDTTAPYTSPFTLITFRDNKDGTFTELATKVLTKNAEFDYTKMHFHGRLLVIQSSSSPYNQADAFVEFLAVKGASVTSLKQLEESNTIPVVAWISDSGKYVAFGTIDGSDLYDLKTIGVS
jgi:hypothetical protein